MGPAGPAVGCGGRNGDSWLHGGRALVLQDEELLEICSTTTGIFLLLRNTRFNVVLMRNLMLGDFFKITVINKNNCFKNTAFPCFTLVPLDELCLPAHSDRRRAPETCTSQSGVSVPRICVLGARI